MKGKENVLSEVNLMMICYNLRRLISIFSVNALKDRLKGLASLFFGFIKENSTVLSTFIGKVDYWSTQIIKNLRLPMKLKLPYV